MDCCGYNTAGVCDKGIGDRVNMGYHCNSPKGKQWVPYHRPCENVFEGHWHQHWPAYGGLHIVPWCSAWVQITERNWDKHLGVQNPPEDFGHAEVGYVWYICEYPQGLWRTGPGARPGDAIKVWGGPPGIPTPDPILVSSYHGRKGERILWLTLTGVSGCCPGGTHFLPNIQYFGGHDFTPLVCTSGI